MAMTNQVSPGGKLTYAYIDGYDDVWFWAIVTDYEGPQDYGNVLMGFKSEEEPDLNHIDVILAALDPK